MLLSAGKLQVCWVHAAPLSWREPLGDMQIKSPAHGSILLSDWLLRCQPPVDQYCIRHVKGCVGGGFFLFLIFLWECYFLLAGQGVLLIHPLLSDAWHSPALPPLCQHDTKVKCLMQRPLCASACTLVVFAFPCFLREQVWGRVGVGSPPEQTQRQNGNPEQFGSDRHNTGWVKLVRFSGRNSATNYWL